MVGNRFAVVDPEASPSFALGRLEPLEEVKEGDGRAGVGGERGGEGGENFWFGLASVGILRKQ